MVGAVHVVESKTGFQIQPVAKIDGCFIALGWIVKINIETKGLHSGNALTGIYDSVEEDKYITSETNRTHF